MAIAEAVGHTDTQGMALELQLPPGDITLYQLTVEADGTISVTRCRAYGSSGASRTQDLVQAIAVADGVPVDAVGIVFDPT